MNTVNSATGALGSALTQATGKSVSSLGVNDFIALMTTQLRYQDPTNPQDSSAFVAQLAQFSSVSGIQEINTSISSLVAQLRGAQAINATTLVGHDVLINADHATIDAGSNVSGEINTPTGTSDINLLISDASGQVVRQFTVPASSGSSAFSWDGTDDSGTPVVSGDYKFSAIANVYGRSTSVTTAIKTHINSVSIDAADSSTVLNTSTLGAVQLTAVRQVI